MLEKDIGDNHAGASGNLLCSWIRWLHMAKLMKGMQLQSAVSTQACPACSSHAFRLQPTSEAISCIFTS